MITLSLSQKALAMSSLTMLMAADGSPLAHWSNIGVGVWILCCLPTQLAWVLPRINACPMRLIWLDVPFRPSRGGRKVLAPTCLGYHIMVMRHCTMLREVWLRRMCSQVIIIIIRLCVFCAGPSDQIRGLSGRMAGPSGDVFRLSSTMCGRSELFV
jgi:hypothetical protein